MQLETEMEALRRLSRIVREVLDNGNCETLRFAVWQARSAAYQAASPEVGDEPELRMRRRLAVILHSGLEKGEVSCDDPSVNSPIYSLLSRCYPDSRVIEIVKHRVLWIEHLNQQPYEDLDAWWKQELLDIGSEDSARRAVGVFVDTGRSVGKSLTKNKPEPTYVSRIDRGAYTTDVPFKVLQHKYAAGGYPGCGGFIELLEITMPGRGTRFVLQDYADDCDGKRYRFREYFDMASALRAWSQKWPTVEALEHCSQYTAPYWTVVSQANLLVCKEHAEAGKAICPCPTFKDFLVEPKAPEPVPNQPSHAPLTDASSVVYVDASSPTDKPAATRHPVTVAVSTNWMPLKDDIDYAVVDRGVSLSIKGFSVRVAKTDEGVCCDIYVAGKEEPECVASTWALDAIQEDDEE